MVVQNDFDFVLSAYESKDRIFDHAKITAHTE